MKSASPWMTQFVLRGGVATGEIRGILIKSILKQAEAMVAELVTSSRAAGAAGVQMAGG